MTSSTSVGPDGAVEEDAIHPCSERSACSQGQKQLKSGWPLKDSKERARQ